MAAENTPPEKHSTYIYTRFKVLPHDIRQEVTEWFDNSKEVNIFITGKTGVGKSTLVNGLVGDKLAEEGNRLDPQTAKVTSYEKEFTLKDGDLVSVTVWDSPGLQDGTCKEGQYLADMKEKCLDMDICIYCVSLRETRFYKGCADITAMKKLTETFGEKMWENALFVLTFANIAEDLDSEILDADDKDKPFLFQKKIELWKEKLASALIEDVGVDSAVADRIQVIPAGHANEPKLLDRDHWLSPFWFSTLYAMHPRAQPAMMKLNSRRIVDNPKEIRKEDLNRFIHEQPLIFSKRGALVGEIYGESKMGKDIGSSMGKDAAVELKLAYDLHSSLLHRAKQAGLSFMAMMKNIFTGKK